MDVWQGKLGEDASGVIKVEGGKLIISVEYALIDVLKIAIDKLELAVPGDQKQWAEMAKALLQSKII